MSGRTLTATKLLIVVPWAVFTFLVLSGELPLVLIAVSLVTAIPMIVLFSRWDVAEVERQPVVALTAPPVEPGETFAFAPVRARLQAATFPAIFTGAALLAVGTIDARLLLPVAAAAALLMWRYLRLRLELRFDGLTVRNAFRTHEVRWSDVQHILLGSDRSGESIMFQLRDRTLALDARATLGVARTRRLVHELRRYAGPHAIEFDPELLRI
jgi:hypothetical protein